MLWSIQYVIKQFYRTMLIFILCNSSHNGRVPMWIQGPCVEKDGYRAKQAEREHDGSQRAKDDCGQADPGVWAP